MVNKKRDRSLLLRRVEQTRSDYMSAVKTLEDLDSECIIEAHRNYVSINSAYQRAVREEHKMQSPLTFGWGSTL